VLSPLSLALASLRHSELFKVADKMKELVKRTGGCDLMKGKILANIFYEPSTRTMCSFAAAMMRMGGQVRGARSPPPAAQRTHDQHCRRARLLRRPPIALLSWSFSCALRAGR
jgi:hypothetical protein